MPARERFPQHHADRPDIRRRRRLVPGEPLRRDVRERPRHVAGLGQRLGLGHLGQPEVEHPRRHALAVRQEDVRRLDVTVEDPGRMGVGEPVAHLRARLDRRLVGQVAGAQSLAVGLSRHELVGDVDVTRVASEAVCAQAGGMPEVRRSRRLALGARGRLPLAGDDLERDVETRPLVAGEPDRAGAAAAEWAQGPVAVEDELGAGERWGGLSHA